ncbi:MAG: aldehyde-activating protein [Cereibacter sphaeroides]|uniref:Aldehyde-activating protein n=1 Tax=Cereibacter sphaeroides TaxID=1063 RepID=A0A2W5SDF9_CERSP|nr:MAG: aldehyde-activating protein [Cereibacter sphaeroides]
MAFDGSCHCGAVSFTVDADLPTEAVSCNCSICRRNGALLAFFPATAFTLKGGDKLSTYTFNSHKIKHMFCQTCGVEPFAMANAPDGTEMRAINLRAVPASDLDALTLKHFDGASK